MKKNKILLFTICLLCFFGFKINTKAASVNLILDYDNTNLSNIISNNQTVIDDIISYIEENNYRNFEYVVSIRRNSSNYYLQVGITSLTADYFFYKPYINQYGLYDGANSVSFYGTPSYADNYHQIVNGLNFTRYTSLNLSSYDNTSIDNLKNDIYSFLHASSNASNNLSDQVALTSSYSLNYFTNSKYLFLYKSSLPIKFHNYDSSPYKVINLSINDNVYYYDDFIPTYYEYISSLTPSINVSNLTPIKDNLNNIIKYTVDVSFSVYDTNNYKYQYCLADDCQDILSNNINLELYQNGSYIFKILDNNDDLIDSYSLTISNITMEQPFIDYSLSISPSCVAFIDNQSRNVCKTLQMKQGTSNPNYFYQYSVNNLDFENFYGSYSINLVQGDSVILRVIDSSNNVVWTSSLTINDLYTIDASLGVFATFNLTSFGKSNYNSNYVEIYLYNLDLNYIDNVYISYNGFSFEKLDVSNKGSYFFAITKDIIKNQQIYLNVKNNNNEIIYTTSYYVDLTSIAKPSLLTFLENFNLSMSGPISNLVTSPIRLLSSVSDYYGTCVPLSLSSRIGNLYLPCMSDVYSSISIDLYDIVRLIFDGIICYYCSINIIYTIKCLISPTDDRIEVINL